MRTSFGMLVLATVMLLRAATVGAALQNDDITASVSQVTIGLGTLQQNYKEFKDDLLGPRSILDFETGNLTTAQIAGGVLLPQFLAEGSLTISSGDTVYDGFLQDIGPPLVYTPYVGTTHNTIISFQARFGIPFRPVTSVALIPYVEIGEHFWRRDVGYVEDYSHLLLGLGGKLLWNPIPKLVVDARVGYGTTILPLMSTDGYDYDLGSRPYLNGYLAFDYRLGQHWHLRLSGEYRNWEYGQSQSIQLSPTTVSVEPRSETTQVVYLFAAGYSFPR